MAVNSTALGLFKILLFQVYMKLQAWQDLIIVKLNWSVSSAKKQQLCFPSFKGTLHSFVEEIQTQNLNNYNTNKVIIQT